MGIPIHKEKNISLKMLTERNAPNTHRHYKMHEYIVNKVNTICLRHAEI